MLSSRFWLVLVGIGLLAANLQAAPLSIRIEDHEFTFDVPLDAVYDYAGAGTDRLYVPAVSGKHYVHGYTYLGRYGTVPAGPPPSPDPYPLYSGGLGGPILFGANMELDMFFSGSDGPYTNPVGDTFEVSLTGTSGHLTAAGWIATQGFPPAPLYPPAVMMDIILLDITLEQVTLLARAGHDTADLVEGIGTINTILGHDPSALGLPTRGTVCFKLMAPMGTSIFPGGVVYRPDMDLVLSPLSGARISGETGMVPEPASALLLILGLCALRRRSRP